VYGKSVARGRDKSAGRAQGAGHCWGAGVVRSTNERTVCAGDGKQRDRDGIRDNINSTGRRGDGCTTAEANGLQTSTKRLEKGFAWEVGLGLGWR